MSKCQMMEDCIRSSCILHICSLFLFWNLGYAKNTRVSATKEMDNSDHVTVVANQARKHNTVFSRVPDPFSLRTNFQRSVINSILADLLFPSFKQNSSWHWETTPKPWRKRAKRHATATKYKPNPSFITLRLHYWVQVFSTPQKYESSPHKLQAHYNSSPAKP